MPETTSTPMTPDTAAKPHVFDATTDTFETSVLQKSMQTPVLVDFWAEWCGPCKTLGPVLEKLAEDYNGAFELARIDVDKEPQLAGAFQVRSIPTLFLVKDGQVLDAVPGALPAGQLREFLKHHGIEPAAATGLIGAADDVGVDAEAEVPPVDPHAEVVRLRAEAVAQPESDELKLDLALALLATGATREAEQLLDGLPANLSTDDRSLRARASLDFAALLKDAPPPEVLEAAIGSDPDDLRARHLLGAHRLVAGQAEAALEQFIEMLRRDRTFDDGLPRKVLIDAFRVVQDPALVSTYRRKMSSLLF
jgi:putative thioredoxin